MRSVDPGDAPAGAAAPEAASSSAAPAEAGGRDAVPRRSGPAAGRGLLRVLLMVVVPLAALAAGGAAWLHGSRVAETDNAYVKADKIPVSAEIAGTVRAVLVRENQAVPAGAPLFRLDDAPLRVALARAEARVAQARADVAALKAGYRTKQAEIALARSRVEFARRDETRQSDLAARNFISASRLDEARHATELATQQAVAVERELARIAETLGGGPDVPADRQPSVLAARGSRRAPS